MRFALTVATALIVLPTHLRAQTSDASRASKTQVSVQGDAVPDAATVALPTLQSSPTSEGHKDPGTATLFGVVFPGAGQLYAGKTGEGLALLAVSAGSVVTGAALSPNSTCSASVPDPNVPAYRVTCTEGKRVPLYVGVGVAVASWLYGAITAGGDARAANEEHHARATPVIEQMDGRTRLGLAYRF